jgi:hypothetical protein
MRCQSLTPMVAHLATTTHRITPTETMVAFRNDTAFDSVGFVTFS